MTTRAQSPARRHRLPNPPVGKGGGLGLRRGALLTVAVLTIAEAGAVPGGRPWLEPLRRALPEWACSPRGCSFLPRSAAGRAVD